MDRRTKYTQKIIKETLLELLEEKEINKITVLELCKKADINRATFYRYYIDIYDLLNKLENEFVDELRESYKNYDLDTKLYDYIYAILKGCENNKKFVKLVFNNKKNILFLNKILEDAYDRCKRKWEKTNKDLTEEDIEYITVYIFNGTIGVINYWIYNDFNKDIETVAKTIENLCYNGIENIINKKEN